MDNANLKAKMSDKLQQTKFSIEANSSNLALNNNALDIIRSNLKSQPLSFELFDIVKSPSGGSIVFSVPGMSGDEAEKDFSVQFQ